MSRALREKRNAADIEMARSKRKKLVKRRKGPRREDIGSKRREQFDAFRANVDRDTNLARDCVKKRCLTNIAFDERYSNACCTSCGKNCNYEPGKTTARPEIGPDPRARRAEVENLGRVKKVAHPQIRKRRF
ncbi:hypothetical protein GALL_519300 [mine drainage metagenome]|uniref:Uncharacterized protein n=1 Tax=mine drainage metagenome TaxID=410659 RepID=A0A1J5PMH4_9ZZZZ